MKKIIFTSAALGHFILFLFMGSEISGQTALDTFGVKKMYPTMPGKALDWFMGYGNYSSRLNKAGSISGSGSNTVMTLSGQERVGVIATTACDGITDHAKAASQGYMCTSKDWKNFEMTSYFYTTDMGSDDFTLYGRGGRHTGSGAPDGCMGSAYKSSIDINGKVRWGKEQWHVSYDYSGGGGWKSTGVAVNGKWVGYKIVVYNTSTAPGTNVVLELWLDGGNNSTVPSNQWQLVDKITDAGGWGTEGAECGGAKDQKITWGGPHVTYRTDAGTVKIKWASVREIDPAPTATAAGDMPTGLPIEIYPNPVADQLVISFPSRSEDAEIVISDVTGNELRREVLDKSKTVHTIGTGQLDNGMYLLLVRSGREIVHSRFVVVH